MTKKWPQVGPDTERSEERHGDCPATEAAAGLTGREHAAASLRAGEDGLRALYAAMDEGLVLHEIVYDRSGRAIDYRILDVNPAFERVTGITRARAVGALASQLYGTGEAPYLDLYARVAASGKPEAFETDFVPMAKSFRISAFSPGKGRFATVFEDVTALKRSAEALQRERDLLQTVMDGARNSHLVLLDRDFNFVRVNDAYARTCGYRPEEMVGRNHFALYPDEESEAIFRHVRDTGEPVEFHDRPFVFPDQPERGVTYWDWTLIPLREASGEVSGLIFSLHDTTARKRAEDELTESRRKYQNLIESTADFIWEMDAQGRYTYCSPQMEKMWGLKPEAMIGRSPFDVMPPEQREAGLAAFTALAGHPQPFSGMRTGAYDAHGRLIAIETSGVPFFDAEGRLAGWRGISRDVTERERVEAALRESEAKYRIVAENPYDWEFWRGPDGRFVYCSPSCERITGHKAEEFIADPHLRAHLIHPVDRARFDEHVREVEERHLVGEGEWRFLRADGMVRWVAHVCQPVFDAGGRYLGCRASNRDTTERRHAEEALRENEARLETVVSKLPGVVLQYDRDLNLVTANEAACKLLGIESLDVSRESIMTRLGARTLDGGPIRLEDLPTSRALRGEIVSGALYRVRPPDGIERILSTSAVPLYKEGRISGVVALWYDVTEQRRLEELRDNLVHMVVHDMTSPLTALHLNVGLVRRSLHPDIGPDTERFLGQLERGIARLIRMTEDLLDASRLEAERLPLAIEPCDLAELTCSAVEDARALAPGIEVRVGTPGPLMVRCDPSLVRRVIENLVSNALKHNPPDAAVEVRVSADATDARVTVRDRGEGIPPEYHEVIFAKFGTVEARRQHKYHSTGLGLTFCRLAVEAHGGRIGVDGKAGEGSTFWFTLPVE